MTTAHSTLGASSSDRWMSCPGSVRLCKTVPNKTSSFAEEGTKAHEVASFYLEKGFFPLDVDDAMLDAVSVYTQEIDRMRDAIGTDGTVLIEHRFDLTALYPGMFGTADCVLYEPHGKILYVYDYKHGAGVPVDVKENSQLMYYALGALLSTKVGCESIEMVIVQPRCPHADGPIRRWRIPAVELLDFASDLVKFAKKTEDPQAALAVGEHCRFCPAAGICPKVHETALETAKEEFSPAFSYDPAKLSSTLALLPVIEGWVKAVRDFAYGEANHGRCPPGWKLVAKRATRKWKGTEDDTAAALAGMGFKEDEMFERSLLSPAQIEKALDSTGKKHLADLYESVSSGTTLAPESDKRPATLTDAKAEFSVVSQ